MTHKYTLLLFSFIYNTNIFSVKYREHLGPYLYLNVVVFAFCQSVQHSSLMCVFTYMVLVFNEYICLSVRLFIYRIHTHTHTHTPQHTQHHTPHTHTNTHTHTHTTSLSLSLSLSLTHTHTHTPHTLSLSLSRSSLTHTHPPPHPTPHTHTHHTVNSMVFLHRIIQILIRTAHRDAAWSSR